MTPSSLLPLLLLVAPLLTAMCERRRRQTTREGQLCLDSFGAVGTCRFQIDCIATVRIDTFQDRRCGFSSGQQLFCCAEDSSRPQFPTVTLPTFRPFTNTPNVAAFAQALLGQAVTQAPENHPNLPLLEDGKGCGISLKRRIIGGRPSDLGRFPWLAVLAYTSSSFGGPTVKCGGALINTRYVLTAAHCVTSLAADYRLHSVRLGEYNLNNSDPNAPKPQEFSAEEVIVHPSYHRPALHRNDLALVRLSRAVRENDGVGRICLPLGEWRQRNWLGKSLTVAGFGLTQSNGEPSQQLMEVNVPVRSLDECQERLGRLARLGPGQLCAGGEQGRDSCRGDSGGPLMTTDPDSGLFYAIGIVSFGPRKCGTVVPGVYTDVASYVGWVLDSMRA